MSSPRSASLQYDRLDPMRRPSPEEATAFLASTRCVWHQRFALAKNVWTPGRHDIASLIERCGLPTDLRGQSVLDIGTCNGAVAFEMERRGADRVVAVDVASPEWFGFKALCALLGSAVEFHQSSVYELPRALAGERFDVVIFWGVLYHLRHPLLALDAVREMTVSTLTLETAIAPATSGGGSWARFHRHDDLANDPSNWFTPTLECLLDWLGSCGFAPEKVETRQEFSPARAMVKARRLPDPPEYARISGERPLRCGLEES